MAVTDSAADPLHVTLNGVADSQGMVLQSARDLSVTFPERSVRLALVTPILAASLRSGEAFVGRAEELDRLGILLANRSSPHPIVVSGMAGIGKTALARQAAATAVGEGMFPAGAFLVNLQGYDPGSAVAGFRAFAPLLRYLGDDSVDVPPSIDEQAAVYHRVLTRLDTEGRALLLVLDNVVALSSVEPLLPTGHGHRVVIVSRDRLGQGQPGYSDVNVPTLSDAESVHLLAESCFRDRDRAPSHAGSLQRLARLCGNLPLALSIVAALFSLSPELTPAELVDDLVMAHDRLDVLTDGDRAVRAAFDLSFARLRPEQALLFELLTLHPGPDFTMEAAVALRGASRTAVRIPFSTLARAHFIEPSTEGHWSMHDLLRVYSSELRRRTVPEQDQRDAVERILEYYATRIEAEDRHIKPSADSDAERLRQWVERRMEAIRWFDSELPSLLATVHEAIEGGYTDIAVRATRHLFHYFDHHRMWPEWEDTHRRMAKESGAAGDEDAESEFLCKLGLLLREQTRYGEAAEALHRSLELGRRAANPAREGWAAVHLGAVLRYLSRPEEAIPILRQAGSVFRGIGDPHGEAWAYQNLGEVYDAIGRFGEAISAHTESLRIRTASGDVHGGVFTWTRLGIVHAKATNYAEASKCLEYGARIAADLECTHELPLITGLAGSASALQGLSDKADSLQAAAIAAICQLASPHQAALALLELGDLQYEIQDNGGAMRAYRAIVTLLDVQVADAATLREQAVSAIGEATEPSRFTA